MKYLIEFQTRGEYDSFIASTINYPNVCLIANDNTVVYNPPQSFPLYVEAIENLTVRYGYTYEYSRDNKTWTSATGSTNISVNAGEVIFFRANHAGPSSSGVGIGEFIISKGKCNVGGNIMSLLHGSDFEGKTEIYPDQFASLFARETKIVNAKDLILPATTLAEDCYSHMFDGCTSLVSAPALPATDLRWGCYSSMFRNCISLVNAPDLPATTLIGSCYNYMFSGCEKLKYIKAMFVAYDNYDSSHWVEGVSPTGTFVKNSAATWENTFGVDAIPEGWTVEYTDS